ncbi:MAG: hypothetical protein ACREFQ_01145, partial [Stellaceae bacterium]
MDADSSENMRFIARSDLGGQSDGVQFMLQRGYGYIGHTYSNGVSVVDLRDPAHPAYVSFIPAPPNTRASHLQAQDDL